MVMWLAKSPIYEKENSQSKDECEQFIDKLITCSNDTHAPVELQRHRHKKIVSNIKKRW